MSLYCEPHCRLAEGPVYDRRIDRFLWLDIRDHKVYWVNDFSSSLPGCTPHYVSVDHCVGVLALTENPDVYLVGAERGFGVLDLESAQGAGEQVCIRYTHTIHSTNTLRLNDGAVSRSGMFFCGSMSKFPHPVAANGKLYRLDNAGNVSVVLEGCSIPNGIGWSMDDSKMYFTDSPALTVYEFDYDAKSGDMCNRRPFICFKDFPGSPEPDGLTMDTDGNFYIALWGAGCVAKYSAHGEYITQYDVPAKNVTCPTFAGRNFDMLMIATAHLDQTSERVVPDSDDRGGEIFCVKLNVRGLERGISGAADVHGAA